MTIENVKPDYDFVIVGARCAGAATARLLAQSGARVLVVDRGVLGADTLSTSYLMRAAVVQLNRWGLLSKLAGAGTPAVRKTHFHYASGEVEVDLRPGDGVDALYAPRRTVLDPILVRAAMDAGAEVRHGVRVQGLLRRTDGRVCGVQLATAHGRTQLVTARAVIGADGLSSSVARWVRAETHRLSAHSAPCVYAYFRNTGVDAFHWYYGRGLAAGVAPTNDGAATCFVSTRAERLPELFGDRAAGLLRVASSVDAELGHVFEQAQRAGAVRAFPGVRGYMRQAYGAGWALVGDAGYFRDPITAHGISDALRDAELLARALLAGTVAALEGYQRTRDAAAERLFEATDQIASFDWSDERIEQLNREAGEGMRDGLRVVRSFDAANDSGLAGSHAA